MTEVHGRPGSALSRVTLVLDRVWWGPPGYIAGRRPQWGFD